MEVIILLFIIAVLLSCIVLCFIFLEKSENKNKKYKESIKYLIYLLKEYEKCDEDYPDIETAIGNITYSIFGEVMRYVPDEDKDEFVDQYRQKDDEDEETLGFGALD